jgi:hypothetical protein
MSRHWFQRRNEVKDTEPSYKIGISHDSTVTQGWRYSTEVEVRASSPDMKDIVNNLLVMTRELGEGERNIRNARDGRAGENEDQQHVRRTTLSRTGQLSAES